MDATNFDSVVRALATHGTRRAVLRRAVVGALGAALAGLGARQPAAAAECRGLDSECRRDG